MKVKSNDSRSVRGFDLGSSGLKSAGLAVDKKRETTSEKFEYFRSVSIQKIYEKQSYSWNHLLKEASGKKLMKSIQQVIDKADLKDDRLWDFIGKALSELHLRKYSKTHSNELKIFKKQIRSKTNNCLVVTSYNIEAAGIKESSIHSQGSEHKIIHPYPRTDLVKKIVKNWRETKSDQSLDKYVATLPTEEKKELSGTEVKYLEPTEYKEYRVTFHGGNIEIGEKSAEDGDYIFALDIDGNDLLAGFKKTGRLHHTSFFAGASVQCAGHFEVRDRKIIKVFLKSGHYHPKAKHGENLREFLSNSFRLGAETAKQLPIIPRS